MPRSCGDVGSGKDFVCKISSVVWRIAPHCVSCFFWFVLAALTPIDASAGHGPACDWDREAALDAAATRLDERPDDVPQPATSATTSTTLTTSCGRGTDLIDTLDTGIVRVPFADGRSINMYPILMTNKEDGQWSCNKVKVRTACVTDSKVTPEGTLLTLKVEMIRNASEEILKVEPNGSVTSPANSKYFALLPQPRIDRRGRRVDDGVRALASAASLKCGNSDECRDKKVVAAEKTVLTGLRHHRLGSLPMAERRKDVRRFIEAYSTLTFGKKALHGAIMLNEIGTADGPVADTKFIYASPLELADAVLWNSAPSYGAHQIDIGSNGGDDLGPFRAALASAISRASPELLKSIRDRTVKRKLVRPLENWGRTYSIEMWGDFYKVSNGIMTEFRSEKGFTDYRLIYDRFLTEGTGCMAALRGRGGVFARSGFAQLYVIDVANQKGAGTAVKLARYAQSLARTQSAAEIQAEMIKWVTDLRTGEDHAADVKRRSDNVTALAAKYPDLSGAPASACKDQRFGQIEKI